MCLENTNRLFRQANLVNEVANVCTICDYPGRSEFAVLANAVHTPSLGVFNMGSQLGEHIVSCYYYFFFSRVVRKQYHTLYKKWSTPKTSGI